MADALRNRITITHQGDGQGQLELHVPDRARMVTVRSVSTCTSIEAGSVSLMSWGSRFLMASTVSIVRAGLAADIEDHADLGASLGRARPGCRRVFSASSTVWCHIGQAHGLPFLKAMIRLFAVLGRRLHLVVGIDGRCAVRAIKAALWRS